MYCLFIFLSNDEWWHRRDQAPIQLETLSPVATHGLLAFVFDNGNERLKVVVLKLGKVLITELYPPFMLDPPYSHDIIKPVFMRPKCD